MSIDRSKGESTGVDGIFIFDGFTCLNEFGKFIRIEKEKETHVQISKVRSNFTGLVNAAITVITSIIDLTAVVLLSILR